MRWVLAIFLAGCFGMSPTVALEDFVATSLELDDWRPATVDDDAWLFARALNLTMNPQVLSHENLTLMGDLPTPEKVMMGIVVNGTGEHPHISVAMEFATAREAAEVAASPVLCEGGPAGLAGRIIFFVVSTGQGEDHASALTAALVEARGASALC